MRRHVAAPPLAATSTKPNDLTIIVAPRRARYRDYSEGEAPSAESASRQPIPPRRRRRRRPSAGGFRSLRPLLAATATAAALLTASWSARSAPSPREAMAFRALLPVGLRTAPVPVGSLRSPLSLAATTTTENDSDSSSSSDRRSSRPPPPSLYERLGSPRTVMAPMVAQSDLPFRRLVRSYGVDLCYTQMIHAKNFVRDETFRINHLDVYGGPAGRGSSKVPLLESQWNAIRTTDSEGREEGDIGGAVGRRWDFGSEGGPVIVQIAGHDPNLMVDAALGILERTADGNGGRSVVDAVDVNLGCPQGIARKGRYGAFLIDENLDLVCEILSALRSGLPKGVGVTAKIRIPETSAELKDRVRRMVDAGIDMLTVHGRTVKENKQTVRECNWDMIATAVRTARSRSTDDDFPVVANGGIEYPSDVAECLDATGASAVMSSEALLENPTLFDPTSVDELDMSPREILDRQLRLAKEYLDLASRYPPTPGSLGTRGGSFNVVRGHLFKMLYRYLEENPDLRQRMGDRVTTSVHHQQAILDELEGRYRNVGDDELRSRPSSKPGSSWYRRHRDAAGRVHSRGDGANRAAGEAAAAMTVEEKKRAIQERIRKLKEERLRKRGAGDAVRKEEAESPIAV